MKVLELIKLLLDEDLDREVIIAKQPGGSMGFSPFYSAEAMSYVADSTWCGEVYLEELDPELRKAGYTEEDLAPSWEEPVRALVLYAVH